MSAARFIIHGRVQGVGFRAFVAREAARRGLGGWVRNRRDGTVEALITGDAAAIDEMAERCRQGPPVSLVHKVERTPTTDANLPDFRELPTV